MRLAAHRDLKPLAVRKLYELRDVLRVAGPQYGHRPVVHHVSKVVSRPLQCGLIEEYMAAELLQIISQRLCCGRVIVCGMQPKECSTACQPSAKLPARNI